MSAIQVAAVSERAEADKARLQGSLSGGEAAFSSLYRRLSLPLFSMVFEIVKDQKDAEDVLQEAFVQIWKKAATYDPPRAPVFTWAVMIARSKAIDRLRARRRNLPLAAAAVAESETVSPISLEPVDECLQRSDEKVRVRIALSRIPAAERAALDLAFFSGLTQSEIAQKLEAPIEATRARIRRGLLVLRGTLAEAA